MESAEIDVNRTLALLNSELEALNSRIAGLSPEQWLHESHCPAWRISDLVMHVVRNGEAFLQFSRRALANDDSPTPGFAYPDRDEQAAGIVGPDGAPRDVAIRNLGPSGCSQLQAEQMGEYATLLSGLNEETKWSTGTWAACRRTISWGSRQRLAEVAYHHWDLRCSLAEYGPLEGAIAREMLDYRLDPGQSPMFRYRPADNAEVTTFRLRSATIGRTWRISVSDDAVPAAELGWEPSPRPRPGRRLEPNPSGSADLEVAAEPGWLALAVAGRGDLHSAHFDLNGRREMLPRFQATFAT